MVLLAGGELDLGDGGDAPRVLHLPGRLIDPLAQHRSLTIQPRDLKGAGSIAVSFDTVLIRFCDFRIL